MYVSELMYRNREENISRINDETTSLYAGLKEIDRSRKSKMNLGSMCGQRKPSSA